MTVVFVVVLLVLPPTLLGDLIGGHHDVDTDRDDVREAAAFAVQEINARANSFYSEMILRIVKAKAQVGSV